MRIGMIGSRGVPATSGGVEKVVEQVGAALVKRGHDVTVFCRSNYYAEEPAREHAGMQLRILPTIGTKHLDAIVHTSLSSVAALRGFDVLHYHGIGPGLLAPLPRALARRTAIVQTVHSLDWQRAKWGLFSRSVLRAGELVSTTVPHAVIVPSTDLVERYRAVHGKAATLIPNPFPTIERRPPSTISSRFGIEPGRYLLFVGRLVPEKRVDMLLRAFTQVETDLRLLIVGGSSYTDDHVAQLRTLADRDDRVIMTGPVHGAALEELFTHARAFVAPSALEGLPITLMEAISAELPIVASAIPPHVELLEASGRGCRLHDAGSEGSLANAIAETIADNNGVKDEIRRRRSRLMTEFSAESVAERTEAVYQQALDRRRRR